ncbi:hypothetical protein DNTS_024970, partial [Danionella cerebrum]
TIQPSEINSVSRLVSNYEIIRRGGLIFAAVLFCLGMAIIFSMKTAAIFELPFFILKQHWKNIYGSEVII